MDEVTVSPSEKQRTKKYWDNVGKYNVWTAPYRPVGIDISINGDFTFLGGGSGSLDFVVANNGMGLGGTVGPSFGTPNASLGISFSLIFPVGDRKSNINDIVGGRGTASSSGVGPLSFIYGKTFDKNYQPTYNLYGIGISPISSRDIPSPFSIGYSTTPINYQFKIFTWQY